MLDFQYKEGIAIDFLFYGGRGFVDIKLGTHIHYRIVVEEKIYQPRIK